jgi:hypothetical protein
MNMIDRPIHPRSNPYCAIAVILAGLTGFIIGGSAERWIHDRDISLGQCVPVHGMQCLDAINKK